MSKWYWKDGTLACDMDSPDWQEQIKALDEKLRDYNYKRVAKTELPNGYWVSTVWLGLDHSWNGGEPLIFETMVFPTDSHSEQDMRRYSTEEEALKGHKELVKKWRKHESYNKTDI